jgi:hypothetical protein
MQAFRPPIKRIVLAFVLVSGAIVAARGCGDDVEPMWIDLDKLTAELEALGGSFDNHHREALAARDLATLQALESSDAGDAGSVRNRLGRMERLIDDMTSKCTGAPGGPPDLAPLSAALAAIRLALDGHRQRVSGAGTLAEALVEETQHRQAAGDLLVGVKRPREDLAARAPAYACRIHNP